MPLTVRSRCMRIGFGPLPASLVQSYFEETAGFDRQKAADLARLAGGSIAAGLFWSDEENYRMRGRIAELLAGRGARPQALPS